MSFFVYMLANRRKWHPLCGMTDDLVRRVWQHREGITPGFTRKYGIKMLVWYELHESREAAFSRQRQIKKWNRAWKLKFIENMNSLWRDLWYDISH